MEHIKYPSIKNTYNSKFIEKIKELNIKQFAVTEKIHGMNASIYYNGDQFKYARRTDFFAPKEKMFNLNIILKRDEDKYKKLYHYFKNKYGCKILIIYGELFGGSYPNYDEKSASIIQKGVFYCPHNDFCIFDFKIDCEFVNHNEFVELCEKFELFYTKNLFVGTLEECLKYPNLFQTTIPEQFNLESVKDNICEGVVIRPIIPYKIGDSYVILKNKNDKFSEKQSAPRKKKQTKDDILSEEAINQYHKLLELLNENRLKNVTSKINSNDINFKQFRKILNLLIEDIYDEYNALYDSDVMPNKEESKIVRKKISNNGSILVRNFIKQSL